MVCKANQIVKLRLAIQSEIQIRRGISPQFLSYYYSKPYVVGTQKNHLTQAILLSTHSIGLEGQIRIFKYAKHPLSRALISAIMTLLLQKCSYLALYQMFKYFHFVRWPPELKL